MENTERLSQYYKFDNTTLDVVEEIAEKLRSFPDWNSMYSDFQSSRSHAHMHETTASPQYGFPIKLIDIIPVEAESTMIYHLPMGNSVDENMQARLMALSTALPNTRIIASSNPAHPRVKGGKLPKSDRDRVSKGIFRDTIEPILFYAHNQKIDTADQVGYSYGADKAVSTASLANSFDIQTPNLIPIEPASVLPRSLGKLGCDFLSSNSELKRYVKASEMPAYDDARKIASRKQGGLIGYTIGLLRLSNVAISKGIASGKFEQNLTSVIRRYPETNSTLIWGTESELSINGIMKALSSRLDKTFGDQRFQSMPIEGGHHAMGDDIFLHTALVHQALNQTD